MPLDESAVVVKPIGELASPPAGGVTVGGSVIPMPVGAFPTHDAEKATGALNPLTEFTVTAVALFSPGVVETVSDVGAIEKSPPFIGTAGVTGARTANVPAIATGIVVVWESIPFDAVTKRV